MRGKVVTKPSFASETRQPTLTGWSFCTKASERVYITAEGCEIEFGAGHIGVRCETYECMRFSHRGTFVL
jgi:hypothetical protein